MNLLKFVGDHFSRCDPEKETFRFIGTENIPYTKNGRNCNQYDEQPIHSLIGWSAELLDFTEVSVKS